MLRKFDVSSKKEKKIIQVLIVCKKTITNAKKRTFFTQPYCPVILHAPNVRHMKKIWVTKNCMWNTLLTGLTVLV